jgi:hypothetical protein
MYKTNLVGLYSNVFRALEIAIVGGFDIKLHTASSQDDQTVKPEDLAAIEKIINSAGVSTSQQYAEIDIEVNAPSAQQLLSAVFSAERFETAEDCVLRAKEAGKIPAHLADSVPKM